MHGEIDLQDFVQVLLLGCHLRHDLVDLRDDGPKERRRAEEQEDAVHLCRHMPDGRGEPVVRLQDRFCCTDSNIYVDIRAMNTDWNNAAISVISKQCLGVAPSLLGWWHKYHLLQTSLQLGFKIKIQHSGK